MMYNVGRRRSVCLQTEDRRSISPAMSLKILNVSVLDASTNTYVAFRVFSARKTSYEAGAANLHCLPAQGHIVTERLNGEAK